MIIPSTNSWLNFAIASFWIEAKHTYKKQNENKTADHKLITLFAINTPIWVEAKHTNTINHKQHIYDNIDQIL